MGHRPRVVSDRVQWAPVEDVLHRAQDRSRGTVDSMDRRRCELGEQVAPPKRNHFELCGGQQAFQLGFAKETFMGGPKALGP